jgi:carbonic anhydrase
MIADVMGSLGRDPVVGHIQHGRRDMITREVQLRCVVVAALLGLSVASAFGQMQKSPIDFTNETMFVQQNLTTLDFDYANKVDAKVKDRGGSHTGADVMHRHVDAPNVAFPIAEPGGPKLVHEGKTYGFHGFHFHLASEHKRQGAGFDMELHMVHKEVGNLANILVVGRWMTKVATPNDPALNAELHKVFNPLPGPAVGDPFPEFNIDAFDLKTLLPSPAARQTYRYKGSLTASTDQGIEANWRFFGTPMQISNAHYDKFKNYLTRRGLAGNATDIQALLDDTTVTTDIPEPSSIAVVAGVVGLLSVSRRRRVA